MAQLMNVSLAGLPVMPMIGSAGCESPQLASQLPEARAAIEQAEPRHEQAVREALRLRSELATTAAAPAPQGGF